MYKTDVEREQERMIGANMTLAVDVNRFKVSHVIANEEADEVQVGLYDTRTNTGIVLNLMPSGLGEEPESPDGLELRYVVQLVTVGLKGYQDELFSDVIHPYQLDPDDDRGEREVQKVSRP